MGGEVYLVKMRGYPGTGKTSVANIIKVMTDGASINSDDIQNWTKYKYFILFGDPDYFNNLDFEKKIPEDLENKIKTWSLDELTIKKYGPEAKIRKYQCMKNEIEQYVIQGKKVIILDATHRKISDLKITSEMEFKYRLKPIIVETVTNYGITRDRMVVRIEKSKKPDPGMIIKSEADLHVYERVIQEFEPYPADIYLKTVNMLDIIVEVYKEFFDKIIVNQERTPQQIGEQVLEGLKKYVHDIEKRKSMELAAKIFFDTWKLDWIETKGRLNIEMIMRIPRTTS
ncbi:MAG: hypothetical protein QXG00_03995 [Candidatus Woesearchaeota archaeon]